MVPVVLVVVHIGLVMVNEATVVVDVVINFVFRPCLMLLINLYLELNINCWHERSDLVGCRLGGSVAQQSWTASYTFLSPLSLFSVMNFFIGVLGSKKILCES